MNTRRNGLVLRNQKQAIAWIIFGVIVFGIVALNGGLILIQQQITQNAADAASLAGALALTQGYNLDQVKDVVLKRAKEDGFDSENPGTKVELSWMSDIVGAGASFSNNVKVTISTDYKSLSSSIFGSDRNSLTVDAVAHARMDEDFAPGYAVVALNDEGCEDSSGDSDAGCWSGGNSIANTNPIPVTGGTQVSVSEVPLPDCSGLADYGEVEIRSSANLEPGKYMSITVGEDASLSLNPGLYCLYGAGADNNSILLADSSQVLGENVMFFMMEDAGGFNSSPTSEVYLSAPERLLDPSGQQWGGMLLYAQPDVDGVFIFSGTSRTIFIGTIYAPGAHCEAQGTKGFVTLRSQIVCDHVSFTEIDGLYISYDMSTNYHLPEAVEIMDLSRMW